MGQVGFPQLLGIGIAKVMGKVDGRWVVSSVGSKHPGQFLLAGNEAGGMKGLLQANDIFINKFASESH